jgi:hypothetical protein
MLTASRRRCGVSQRRALRQEAGVVPKIVMRHAGGRELRLKHGPDTSPIELTNSRGRAHRLIFRVNNKAGDTMFDHFRHRSATEGYDGCAAGQCLDHEEAERLRPVDGKQQGCRTLQEGLFGAVVDLADEFRSLAVDQGLQFFIEVAPVTARDLGCSSQGHVGVLRYANGNIRALLRGQPA